MSANITLGSTLGGLVLLIIIGVVVITGSKANEEAAIQAQKDSEAAHAAAQHAHEQSEENNRNIQQINATLTDFISDRNAAFNKTFEYLDTVVNATHSLTSEEYNRAAEKKVENILGNMTEEHELIFKALNVTKTETMNEDQKLEQLIKGFIEAQKDNGNQTK